MLQSFSQSFAKWRST